MREPEVRFDTGAPPALSNADGRKDGSEQAELLYCLSGGICIAERVCYGRTG